MINYYIKCRYTDRLALGFKHRSYNLMEHQYMVGMLFRHFALLEDVSYDINVWNIIFHHDIVETCTLDLPYTVKNFNERVKQSWDKIEEELINKHFKLERYNDKNIKESLTPIQYSLFKACDILDLYIFTMEEISIGNNSKYMKEVESNCKKIINSLDFKFPHIKKFIDGFKG